MPEGERTERPTPRKLQRARQRGHVPRSREMQAAVAFAAVVLLVPWIVNVYLDLYGSLMAGWITAVFQPSGSDLIYALWGQILIKLVVLVAVVGAVVLLANVGGAIFFGGWVLAWARLTPRFDALSPVQNLKSLFSLNRLTQTIFSIAKLILITWLVYTFVKGRWYQFVATVGVSYGPELYGFIRGISDLLMYAALLYFALAILDWYYQRWSYIRSMMMTKEEVKEELKSTEGNPRVKSAIRKKMYALVMRRMLWDVNKATVVVTNPTEFAVALRYTSDMPAPKIVAKGAGWLAAKIKMIARRRGIPIFRRPALARRLFFAHEVGDYIKPDFYLEVAEIISKVLMRERSRVANG